MQLGNPFLVGHPPGLGKSPGFFDYAVRINNPTVEQLRDDMRAAADAREYERAARVRDQISSVSSRATR